MRKNSLPLILLALQPSGKGIIYQMRHEGLLQSVSTWWQRFSCSIRLWFLIGGGLTITLAILALATHYVAAHILNRSTDEQAKQASQLTQRVVWNYVHHIRQQTENKAEEDDLHEVLANHDQGRLHFDLLEDAQPGILLIFNRNRELVGCKGLSRKVALHFCSPPLLKQVLQGGTKTGFHYCPQTKAVYAWAAAPIRHRKSLASPVGVLVMARKLDSEFVATVARWTQFPTLLFDRMGRMIGRSDDPNSRSYQELSRVPDGLIYAGEAQRWVLTTLKQDNIPVCRLAILYKDPAGRLIKAISQWIMVGLPFLIPGCAFGITLLLRILLFAPFRSWAQVLDRIRSGDLNARFPLTGNGDLFDRFAQQFNKVMAQLQDSFQRLEDQNAEIERQMKAFQQLNERIWEYNAKVTALNAQLEQLASLDGLTELYNHRVFQERLREFFNEAKRYNLSLSLILLDVDHFKAFNDMFGHQGGDQVLKEVAAVIRATIRSVDLPARYGGEEFAILLPNTDLPGALPLAERIRCIVEQTENPYRPITVSIGVATLEAEMTAPGLLIEQADRALYAAKQNGRNQVYCAIGKGVLPSSYYFAKRGFGAFPWLPPAS